MKNPVERLSLKHSDWITILRALDDAQRAPMRADDSPATRAMEAATYAMLRKELMTALAKLRSGKGKP